MQAMFSELIDSSIGISKPLEDPEEYLAEIGFWGRFTQGVKRAWRETYFEFDVNPQQRFVKYFFGYFERSRLRTIIYIVFGLPTHFVRSCLKLPEFLLNCFIIGMRYLEKTFPSPVVQFFCGLVKGLCFCAGFLLRTVTSPVQNVIELRHINKGLAVLSALISATLLLGAIILATYSPILLPVLGHFLYFKLSAGVIGGFNLFHLGGLFAAFMGINWLPQSNCLRHEPDPVEKLPEEEEDQHGAEEITGIRASPADTNDPTEPVYVGRQNTPTVDFTRDPDVEYSL
jgi:hypothetical protein